MTVPNKLPRELYKSLTCDRGTDINTQHGDYSKRWISGQSSISIKSQIRLLSLYYSVVNLTIAEI